MQRLGGKEVADKIVEDLKIKVEELKGKGISPKLAILRVGARDDDLAYERGVLKRFESADVEVEVTAVDAGISQFRPLPKGLSDEHMRRTIDPGKDSDFMDIRNMENVLAGVPDCAAPCTAEAVMALIKHYNIETKGKKVTVVGRSLVIGKPVALLLTTANATVTVCHTKTADIEAECRNADIIVACCGVAKMITDKFVKPGQTVIDLPRCEKMRGLLLCGQVLFRAVYSERKKSPEAYISFLRSASHTSLRESSVLQE